MRCRADALSLQREPWAEYLTAMCGRPLVVATEIYSAFWFETCNPKAPIMGEPDQRELTAAQSEKQKEFKLNISKILNSWRVYLSRQRSVARAAADARSLGILAPLTKNVGFVPWSRSAVSPTLLLHIINEITINKRVSIIEFGCGLSTIYLSSFSSLNNVRIISIDEDQEWAATIESTLKSREFANNVELYHVPREPVSNGWYSRGKMEDIVGSAMFDLVIVDGPSAYSTKHRNSRREAGYFLRNHLSASCSIFLDDTGRRAEREIALDWARDLDFTIWDNSNIGGYSWLHRGSSFFSAP